MPNSQPKGDAFLPIPRVQKMQSGQLKKQRLSQFEQELLHLLKSLNSSHRLTVLGLSSVMKCSSAHIRDILNGRRGVSEQEHVLIGGYISSLLGCLLGAPQDNG